MHGWIAEVPPSELFVLSRINPVSKSKKKRIFNLHSIDVAVVREALKEKRTTLEDVLEILAGRNWVRKLDKESMQCSVTADNTRHAMIPYISDLAGQLGKNAKRSSVGFFAGLKQMLARLCLEQQRLESQGPAA